MPESVISVVNFSKSFGDAEVVSGLSFEVRRGEIFAFLGANGSGKTTTIRCLLDILKPTSGTMLVNGKKYLPGDAQILGYLPEERGLHGAEKVLDTMIYFGELKGLSRQKAKSWSLEFLKKVGLEGKENLKIKKLSSGQQQKIQLGITIINNPELLVLDEPTKGLDPVNRTLLMDMLMDLNKNGSTIIFITHQMEEVEKIADRLLMIKDGQKVLYGEVDEVRAQFGQNKIYLEFKGNFPDNDKLYTGTVENNWAEITPNSGVAINDILKHLINSNLEIKKFELALPSLNEIFVKIQNNEK